MRLYEIRDQQQKIKQIRRFAQWAMTELEIDSPPEIVYGQDADQARSKRTFGTTNNNGQIWVHVGNRVAADVMRTLCHELVHHRQFELGIAHDHMDDEETLYIEDQANAVAGRMMREYGKSHKEIYEWKISKSALTEAEFVSAYNLRQKRERNIDSQIPFRPGQMLASTLRRLREDKLWESEHRDIRSLKEFQKLLNTLDERRKVKMVVGGKVSILQFEPHTYSGVIEVRGFIKPKKIVNIEYKADGVVDWIDFSDGSSFPDKEFLNKGKGGGEYEGISTLFFPNEISANRAYTFIWLHEPEGWRISAANLNENKQQLSETRTGSLQHEVADSLPQAFMIPALDSGNPYLQYKFGVAIAAARGAPGRAQDHIPPFEKNDLPEVFSDKEVVISFDPNIDKIIDAAMRELNIPGGKRRIGVEGSRESGDVNKNSPVKGFKGFKK